METRKRISLLVIPSDQEGTVTIHVLLDRKTLILSLAEIPGERISQIVQEVYTHPGIWTEAGTD